MKRIIDIPELIYKSIIADENEKVCCRQNYELINIIKNSKPYEERPQNKWIKIFENPFTNGYVCPFCGHKIQVTEQFLPKVTECEVCGAELKGVAE